MNLIRALGVLILIPALSGCVSVAALPQDEVQRLDEEIASILSNRQAPPPPENGTPAQLPPNLVSEAGFIWPLKGTVLNKLGESGINIKAIAGAPVYAAKSGMVIFVTENFEGYGKLINIKHSDGFISVYAYNSEILVKTNQIVKQGEVIAKAGQTGRAESPQLHFRLFYNEKPVNPLNYLP